MIRRLLAPNSGLPLLFIMGPTASGKTALAVELVRRFPFEIISVDSALVYKGMDIGTAKPDAATLRAAPHRLIDILDPSEAYSVAQFCSDANRAMEQIRANGRIPLLVGGTMMYFRALQQGLSHLPSADPQVRARLGKDLTDQGSAALHARLARIDRHAAARIHPNDPQRIQRALEVYELTGRTMTELCSSPRNEISSPGAVKLVMAPTNRRFLHHRIEQRFKQMLECGLLTEVASLHARPDLGLYRASMRAVGYRQVWEYLDGLTSYQEMVRRGFAATRQFAKRQFTWLRAEPNGVWLDSADGRRLDKAIACLRETRFFARRPTK